MVLREPATVCRIAVIGAGVIGCGWAAHFLARGYDVLVQDPDCSTEHRLRSFVDAAWPTLERLGLATGASRARLQFTQSLEIALNKAHFVQECAPDDRILKSDLFKAMDAIVPSDVVIASSTSGIPMTEIQALSRNPERMVVGHPFNPPYLMPLVEVVGGERTNPATIDWAMAFYCIAGKRALKLDREILGFVANRLQEAVWREALHMIAAGEATVEQIDVAVVEGPGLRWAVMGPCLTFHLGGGRGGITHMLKHFEPALLEPWCRMSAPHPTPELYQLLEEGCRQRADGRSMEELIHQRDADLVRVLGALGRLPLPNGSEHT